MTKTKIYLANTITSTRVTIVTFLHRLIEYVLPAPAECVESMMHRGKMEEQILFCGENSHFVAFLVASDDAITIVTAETNLGNILETWGIPFREVNAFYLHNQ